VNGGSTIGGFKGTVWSIGILGAFLLAAYLVWAMVQSTRPAPLGAARIAERYKFLRDMKTAEADALGHYAIIDPARGTVRVPVQRAMELMLEEWKDPAAARKAMITRSDKATTPVNYE
jgi:hypothetical protein